MQTKWQTVWTLIRFGCSFRSCLIWVSTVCPDLSVRIVRIIMVFSWLNSLSNLMRLWCFSFSVNSFFKCACAAIQWVIFGRTLRLHLYLRANSEGSCETAWMQRFAWAFAGRLCDKDRNFMSWINSSHLVCYHCRRPNKKKCLISDRMV